MKLFSSAYLIGLPLIPAISFLSLWCSFRHHLHLGWMVSHIWDVAGTVMSAMVYFYCLIKWIDFNWKN